VGGRLQKVAAIIAAASAFAGTAAADEALDRLASAGATAKTSGWTASLFVTQPAKEKDVPALAAVTTVGARLSRPLAKHTRVSVDVFNILGKSPASSDYFAATHSAPLANETDFFHPADGRGIRIGIKVTF